MVYTSSVNLLGFLVEVFADSVYISEDANARLAVYLDPVFILNLGFVHRLRDEEIYDFGVCVGTGLEITNFRFNIRRRLEFFSKSL